MTDERAELLARLFVTRIALRCSTYNQHGSCATCNGMAESEAVRAIAALEDAGYSVARLEQVDWHQDRGPLFRIASGEEQP